MKCIFKTSVALVLLLCAETNLLAEAGPLLQLNTGGPTAVTRSMLLNNDETLLITSGDDKVIRVWDTKSLRQIRQFRGHIAEDIIGATTSMAISPDDKLLAVSVFYPHLRDGIEVRGYLRIFDLASGEIIKLLEGHTKALQSLSFSPNGELLVGGESLEDDPKVLIWDTSSWQIKRVLAGHQDGVSSVLFEPNSNGLITTSFDGSIRIWDIQTGKLVEAIKKAHKGRVYSAAIASLSQKPVLVTSGADKKVKVWNYQSGKVIRTVKFDRIIRKITVDSKGKNLFAASLGEHVNAWIAVVDVSKGKIIKRYKGHNRSSREMVLSRDNNTVYSTGGFRHEIDRWQISDLTTSQRTNGVGKPVQAVAFSEDGKSVFWGHEPINWSGKKYNINTLAALSNSLELESIHGQLGEPKLIENTKTKHLRAIRKLDDLSFRRVRSKKSNLYTLLDIKRNGNTLGTLERDKRTGHIHTAYTFTPDGNFVVSGGEVGYLSLHLLNGMKVGDFKGHTGDITDLAVTKDSRLLISGSRDQTFKIWDIHTRELLMSYFSAQNGEWIAWTSTGHYASSPNGDRYIGWVINQGLEVNSVYVKADQLKKKLYRPDIVQKVLSSRSLEEALSESHSSDFSIAKLQDNKIAPLDFSISSPESGFETDQDKVDLEINLPNSTRHKDVGWSVSINNRQVINKTSAREIVKNQLDGEVLVLSVDLELGDNLIKVFADNNESEKELVLRVIRTIEKVKIQSLAESDENNSILSEPIVDDNLGEANKPTVAKNGNKLLVISIGVDKYINLPKNSLKYAAKDADAIARVFVQQEGKNFDAVESIVLSDNSGLEPTRANIIDALDALADLRPNDSVILFLAGHGVIEDTDYFFLPRDALLTDSGRWKKSTVIAWDEIQRALQSSLGRRILLVDTCYSEGAFNIRLVKESEDSNIIVMSSTDANTLAQEKSSLGHGVFTYALLSGIEGEADSYKDGKVTMSELNAFVSNAVPSLTKNQQRPTLSVPGGFQDFVLASL